MVSEAAVDAYIAEHLRHIGITDRDPRRDVRRCLEAAAKAEAQLLRDILDEVLEVYESEPAVRGALRYLKHRLTAEARAPDATLNPTRRQP